MTSQVVYVTLQAMSAHSFFISTHQKCLVPQSPHYFCIKFDGNEKVSKYRAEKKYLQMLLSRTQAGPGRKVKQEQEEISRNHVQAF